MASSSSSWSCSRYSSPCAACKLLRRKCLAGCIFAPYFPPEEAHKFANVHKIFGASNVAKLLNELPPQQREDAVDSLAYEAEARVRDPVYGCVGDITFLQGEVDRLHNNLQDANARLIRYYGNYCSNRHLPTMPPPHPQPQPQGVMMMTSPPPAALGLFHHQISAHAPNFHDAYSLPWDHHHHNNPSAAQEDMEDQVLELTIFSDQRSSAHSPAFS